MILFLLLLPVVPFVLLWFFYRKHIFEVYRSELFNMRTELLLIASEGELAFESDLYKSLEKRLNTLLRYCEDISWSYFILISILVTPYMKKHNFKTENVGEIVKKGNGLGFDYSESLLNRLSVIEERAYKATILLLFVQNLFTAFFVAFLTIGYMLKDGFKKKNYKQAIFRNNEKTYIKIKKRLTEELGANESISSENLTLA